MRFLSRLTFSITLILLVGATAVFFPTGSRAESKKSSAAAGSLLFKDKGCAYCHGASLQGTERGPSIMTVRGHLKASQIAGQIKNGGQKMPPFGDSLSQDEIAELVSFLRAKHPDVAKPPVNAP